MWRRIAGILPAVVLVVHLVVSVLSVEGSVLCFGEDGHVAIEFVDACNGSGLGSQLAGMESDACGACEDVEFLIGPAYTKNASHDMQTFSLISTTPVSLSVSRKDYPHKHTRLPEYSLRKTLASLYSIVLLI